MGRERQGESTRRMFAAKVGEKGLFPRTLQPTACPAAPGSPAAQRGRVTAASPAASPLGCPNASDTYSRLTRLWDTRVLP